MNKLLIKNLFQMPWHYIKFNPIISSNVVPNFKSRNKNMLSIIHKSFTNCNSESFDNSTIIQKLHSNATLANDMSYLNQMQTTRSEYDDYNDTYEYDKYANYPNPRNNITLKFLSFSYPMNIYKGYSGFILWNGNYTKNSDKNLSIYSSTLSPFETGKTGYNKWKQVGPTQIVHPIIYYTDTVVHKTYVLMTDKIINGKRVKTIACGDRVINSNENIFQTVNAEIRKNIPNKNSIHNQLAQLTHKGKIVYCGPLISYYNTNTSWEETTAISIPIPPHLAKNFPKCNKETDLMEPYWFPTQNLNMNTVNDKHKVLIYRAIRRKVRYIQFPESFWSTNAIMMQLALRNKTSYYDIDMNKVYRHKEIPILISAPDDFSVLGLWEIIESKTDTDSNLVIIDPINHQLKKENPDLYEAIFHAHLLNKHVRIIFIFPKNLTPTTSLNEMKFLVKNNIIHKCTIFIEKGFSKKLIKKIPSELLPSIRFYDHIDTVDNYIMNVA